MVYIDIYDLYKERGPGGLRRVYTLQSTYTIHGHYATPSVFFFISLNCNEALKEGFLGT